MQETIEANGNVYVLSVAQPLSPAQRQELINQFSAGCPTCNQVTPSGMRVMAPTCTVTTKNVGDTVTLAAAPSGGTAPYAVSFRKNGVQIGTASPTTYVIQAADAGTSITFSVTTTDSCPTGAKTCTEQCIISVPVPCATPVCNFSLS